MLACKEDVEGGMAVAVTCSVWTCVVFRWVGKMVSSEAIEQDDNVVEV